MKTAIITIDNPTGLHARPAAMFVQTAAKFISKITLQKEDKVVDAKSILKVLSLGIRQGTKIIIDADGEDEGDAIKALTALISGGFGE